MDIRQRLVKKLERNPAAILTAEEVGILVSEAHESLGPLFSVLITERPQQFEDIVRWNSVKARCEQARAGLGIDIKAAAARLRIPQYRIAAIEAGRLHEFGAAMAWTYFEFLGIHTWVHKWAQSNVDLATRAGIVINSRSHARDRKSNPSVNPPVRPVTRLASARPAPCRPAGYRQR